MTIRIGLLPILVPFVALPLAACDKASIDTALANIKGENAIPIVNLSGSVPDYSADVVAALITADTVEQSSSSSSAEQVAYVPPPEECHVTAWREIFIDCHGFNVDGPER